MRAFVLLVALALAGCLGPSDPAPDVAPSPYVELQESPIRGLTPEEIEGLRTGAGMSLALPAELNGWPGPKHVLELADELGLSREQRESFEALYAETNAEARRVGEDVIALQVRMEAAFRDGSIDEATLDDLGATLAERWGELRLVHLRAHLRSADLLTEHQIAMYGEYRGYGSADHASHAHGA